MSAFFSVNEHPIERIVRVAAGLGLVAAAATGALGVWPAHRRGAGRDRPAGQLPAVFGTRHLHVPGPDGRPGEVTDACLTLALAWRPATAAALDRRLAVG